MILKLVEMRTLKTKTTTRCRTTSKAKPETKQQQNNYNLERKNIIKA